MSLLNLFINTNDTEDFVSSARLTTAQRLQQLFKSMAAGSRLKNTSLVTGETPVAATGTVTIESGAGTITATINGVAIQVTWTDDDDNTATLLAAAIEASSNALVDGKVTATAAANVVTITSALKYGSAGNAFTLAASGTGATASGARLTGGSDGTVTSFEY